MVVILLTAAVFRLVNHRLMDKSSPFVLSSNHTGEQRKGAVFMNINLDMHRIGQTIPRSRREYNMT